MAKPRRNSLSETAAIASDILPRGKPRTRAAIVHQTLYLPRPLYRQLRQLAAIRECRMHDLVLEGLDKVFKENGLKPRAELENEYSFAPVDVTEPLRPRGQASIEK